MAYLWTNDNRFSLIYNEKRTGERAIVKPLVSIAYFAHGLITKIVVLTKIVEVSSE